jgi:anti-sigma B factor antagonist
MNGFYIDDGVQLGDGLAVLSARGEIDYEGSPELQAGIERTIEEGCTRLVLDLSEVTFIDSTGVGVLVGALAKLEEVGGALAVVSTQDNVLRVFEITGLNRFLAIHDEREHALSALTLAG